MELQFRTLAVATAASASAASRALVDRDQKPGGAIECKSVGDVFGFPANALPEGGILGGQAAFLGVGKTDPMALGDLVLSEEARNMRPSTGRHTLINVLPTSDRQATLAGTFALMRNVR